MKKVIIPARPNWQQRCDEVGFTFHSMDGVYWVDDQMYVFSKEEARSLSEATEELHRLYYALIPQIIKDNRFADMGMNPVMARLATESWERRDPHLYGRFDIAMTEHGPKLLEYNADTPTGLVETAHALQAWAEDTGYNPMVYMNELGRKQFQTIGWEEMFMACSMNNIEDYENIAVIAGWAKAAGCKVNDIFVEDMKIRDDKAWVGKRQLDKVFKLYPWEWLSLDASYEVLSSVQWLEPAWKAFWSNKATVALLWEYFPGHPLLVPAFLAAPDSGNWVKKPKLSREGANIELLKNGAVDGKMTPGMYGAEGYVYQQFMDTSFEGKFPTLGGWVVGDKFAGLLVRHCDAWVTDNFSNYIPYTVE